MPASACHTYKDPEGKAAWDALNKAETNLEKVLRNADGCEPEISGHVYFIDTDGRMKAAPANSDGSADKPQAFHRTGYEGLTVSEMNEIEKNVNDWLDNIPGFPG